MEFRGWSSGSSDQRHQVIATLAPIADECIEEPSFIIRHVEPLSVVRAELYLLVLGFEIATRALSLSRHDGKEFDRWNLVSRLRRGVVFDDFEQKWN